VGLDGSTTTGSETPCPQLLNKCSIIFLYVFYCVKHVRTTTPSGMTQFLGVRLTEEELRDLDEFQRTRKIATRSDAVRTLVREAREKAPTAPTLPLSVQRELEEVVEDGWARSEDEALTLLATFGFQELSRLHADRVPALRGAARANRERHLARRKADREGRGLLER